MNRGIMKALALILFLFVTGAFAMSQAQTPQSTSVSSGGATSSAVPQLVRFSGALKDVNGRSMSGIFGVTFAIYADQEGGAALWMETQSVTADAQGKYSVVLGSQSNGIPDFVFGTAQGRWLGVQPAQQPEMPRVLLVSVPYALKAGDANTLGGLPPSAFLRTGTAAVAVAPATASANAIANANASPLTTSDVTTTGGTANFLPLWTGTTTILNSALFQSGTSIGINNKAPAATLDVTGSGIFRGFLELPAISTATKSIGSNSRAFQLFASSFNSATSKAVSQEFEWQAEPTGNGTASPSASLHLLFGSGINAPAETGLSVSNGGIFTFASGQTFPGTGSGTITGVTAGTDLTGGGTTGTVTLNLDTTKVPTLGSANTFTGNQTISGNVIASGAINGGTANFTGAVTTGAETVKGNISETGNITSTGSISGGSGSFSGNTTPQILHVTQSGNGHAIIASTSFVDGAALYGTNFAASGPSIAVVGQVVSPTGIGVYGNASAAGATGVEGTQAGTSGFGVFGVASGASGTSVGTEGDAHSSSGVGVLGRNFFSGVAVQGSAQNGGIGVQGLGGAYGVEGATTVTTGVGVYGANSSSGGIGVLGSGAEYGVQGTTAAAAGVGVYGANSTSGIAVEGNAEKGGTGVQGMGSAFGVVGLETSSTGVGVYGQNLGTGLAAEFVGTTFLGGPVGVGTSTPVTNFNVNNGGLADSDNLLVGNNSSKGVELSDQGGASAVFLESFGVPLYVNDVIGEPLYLNASGVGAVTVGTNSPGPSTELTVQAPVNNTAVEATTSGTGFALSANSAGNDAITATNNSSNNTTLAVTNETTSGSSFLFFASAPLVSGSPKCTIDTSANLVCSGSKSAVVPVDGGNRMVALYAEESAENWFSDYGTGHLVNGEVTIQLDPTYIQTVDTGGDYHVFLTPNGDCRGLYIAEKSPSSFVVRELNGGRSTLSFDYRIVAKRKGYEQIRLADKTAMMAAVNANTAAIADRQKASAAAVQSRPSRTVIASKPHPKQ